MTLPEIIISIFLALAIGLFFYYVFKVSGPWGSFWVFLLILTLAALASEAWLTPFGPTIYGASWLGAFITVFIIALLIAAATPTRREITREPVPGDEPITDEPGVVALSAFFWIFLIFMTVAALWGIITPPA